MDARIARHLGELQLLVWSYQMARFPRQRRSLSMRIRWELRRFAGTADYAVARDLVGQLRGARCPSCGVVRRRTRLVR